MNRIPEDDESDVEREYNDFKWKREQLLVTMEYDKGREWDEWVRATNFFDKINIGNTKTNNGG